MIFGGKSGGCNRNPPESKDSKGNDYFSGWFVSFVIMIKNKKILALKYRPQIFEDLIGQDIVADTILNSIKNRLKSYHLMNRPWIFVENIKQISFFVD